MKMRIAWFHSYPNAAKKLTMTQVSVSNHWKEVLFQIYFNFFLFSDDKDLDEDGTEQNRLKSDEERKYGKIPARIYFLYLRACGMVTLVVFFMSTLLWQALRVYTDVWLREWTDNDDTADVCAPLKILSHFFAPSPLMTLVFFMHATAFTIIVIRRRRMKDKKRSF